MLIVISSPNKSDPRKMDQRTCAIKEPAADLLVSWITALLLYVILVVIIFLCVLTAQANCGLVRAVRKARALNATISLMREEMQTALNKISTSRKIPDSSCLSLNTTELVGPEQRSLTADSLSSFRCYMLKVSELTPELTSHLQIASQYSLSVERLMNGPTTQRDCRLPTWEQHIERYMFVKCLLKLLDQRLSQAGF